ncbi:predicted protein [Sclerotinia sclerotiorum 1980 UF-70]|uniref:Uncharacterized protein n=1 Tax=Sclerotinia sclerotiorum (strain ATCC 18683 / 1980 / Ss-1) TaxID=665079 RepID=A7EP91_SCLS1|nr:predicted protein [Sclerotinia sclerotiorum 1980 UF-70]EDO04657.1 predicted protein [Sclerotinia sclerotiorum 1980 UF-70]
MVAKAPSLRKNAENQRATIRRQHRVTGPANTTEEHLRIIIEGMVALAVFGSAFIVTSSQDSGLIARVKVTAKTTPSNPERILVSFTHGLVLDDLDLNKERSGNAADGDQFPQNEKQRS